MHALHRVFYRGRMRTPHDALHEAHADLVLMLGDQAVVAADFAHELEAAPVKAGHDGVALQQHSVTCISWGLMTVKHTVGWAIRTCWR